MSLARIQRSLWMNTRKHATVIIPKSIIGTLRGDSNVKVIIQDSKSVKAPEFSHTAGRIYAVVKEGQLKHLAYYDENHKQSVSINLAHPHKGVQPHRHEYLSHNKNDPGIPPTAAEEALIKKIKKEFHLR